MTSVRGTARDLLIVDLSTIRFQWSANGTSCAALTSRGEVLAVVENVSPAEDPREVAYLALDAALDRGQVLRPAPGDPSARVTYRIGLYNPFSAEVSVGAVPTTVAYTDGEPLPLEEAGSPARLTGSARQLTLTVGERSLSPRQLTFAALTRRHLDHQPA